MIRINLLPFRAARTKENVNRQIVIYLIVVCVLVATMGGIWFYLNSEIDSRKDEIAQITKEVAVYRKRAREVDRIKKQLANLRSKTDVINSLETTKKGPVFLLDSMTSMLVKNRMWLTSMSFKGQSVSIDGVAMDEKTIADFMTNLEGGRIKSNGEFVKGPSKAGKAIFSNVSLKTLRVAGAKRGVALKNFVIVCKKIQ